MNILKRFQTMKSDYEIYKRIVKEDGCKIYHIAPSGSGDIYIIGRFYETYINKRFFDVDSVALIVAGNVANVLANMYGISNKIPITVDECKKLIELCLFFNPDKEHLQVLHWGLAMDYVSILKNLEGLHGLNMYTMYKYAVFDGIPENKPLENSSDDLELIYSLFREYKLTMKKTVLLVPYTNSSSGLPPEHFWEKIARELISKGYSVCTNTGSVKEKAIKGTQGICIPIDQIIPFLNHAGYMISVRTGFADITSEAKCRRIVLYPIIKNKGGNLCTYREALSINAMFGKNADIEIEYKVGESEKVIPQILRYF